MKLLNKTIFVAVVHTNPTMICMCEVGLPHYPLTLEQMNRVADECVKAWKDAAGEDLKLTCMFEPGAPYMTIYKDGPIRCSSHRILKNLYFAQNLPRTAQTFLCHGPGGDTADVINVHAPSGKPQLFDQQRQTLLTTLLQSGSRSVPGQAIGRARFLIGGDMNTDPPLLSQLLQTCRNNGSLHTQATIHEPEGYLHGDLCFSGGLTADTLTKTADNHDRKHKPYGICWRLPQGPATEQPSPFMSAQTNDEPATHQRAASSSGYATGQPLKSPPRPAPTPQPPMPESVASSSSAAPPRSLGDPIAEACRLMEAVP